MAVNRQTNYGQTSGVSVTANSGTTVDGSTLYGSVSALAAQTLAFDNAWSLFNDISVKFASGATAGSVYVGFGANVTYATQSSVSACFYLTANPAASIRLLSLPGNATLSLGSAGLLNGFDNAGVGGGATTNALPLNAGCRVELRVVVNSATVGQLEYRLFTDPFSDVPLESKLTAATLNTTTSAPTDARAGMVANGGANFGPAWLTQLQYCTDAGLYPPPPRWSRRDSGLHVPMVTASRRASSW